MTRQFKVERQCPICGKVFTTTRRTKKYCSDECRIKNDRKKAMEANRLQQETREEVECPVCGKKFKPDQRHVKYCSAACREALNKEKKKEYEKEARMNKEPVILTCGICGKSFERTMERRFYCSDACKNIAKERQKVKRRKSGQQMICPVCGKPFKKSAKRRVCCSEECQVARNRQKTREWNLENRKKDARVYSEVKENPEDKEKRQEKIRMQYAGTGKCKVSNRLIELIGSMHANQEAHL